MKLRILIVHADMQSALPLARYFTQRGDEVWQAWELGQAWALIGQIKPQLMLMNLHFASGEWINFLRRVRLAFPEIKVIMTNKYPDLQREMLAREQNVQVFLRQPFSTRWIEQALNRLDEETRPVRMPRRAASKNGRHPGGQPAEAVLENTAEKKRASRAAPLRMPLWVKFAFPYLLLMALLGLVCFALAHWGAQIRIDLASTALAVLLALLVGLSISGRTAARLGRLAQAYNEVALGKLEMKVETGGQDEVARLAKAFNFMVIGLQEGEIYRDLLGRSVLPEEREQLQRMFASGSLRLEGQQAVVTVLVSELRGFAQISKEADPPTIFQWLNEYYAQVVPVVAAHGGVVNQFVGDRMLALFGLLPCPLSSKQSASAACQAALELLEAIEQLNHQRVARGEPPIDLKVSINTGTVSAGGLGARDRLHYTILGDAVDLTNQLAAMTPDLLDGSHVLIGQATYDALGGAQDRFSLDPLDAFYEDEGPLPAYRLEMRAEPERAA